MATIAPEGGAAEAAAFDAAAPAALADDGSPAATAGKTLDDKPAAKSKGKSKKIRAEGEEGKAKKKHKHHKHKDKGKEKEGRRGSKERRGSKDEGKPGKSKSKGKGEEAAGEGDLGEDEDDVEDEYQATEAELEEERQDEAVRHLQGLYRARKSRRLIKELVKSNFVKEWDEETQHAFYKNKRTGKTSWLKPRALGSDDLPSPRVYKAPKTYRGKPSKMRQFALVISCRKFMSGKIADLPPCIEKDHHDIHHTLVHPHLCRYDESDCIFLLNPVRQAVEHSFDELRRRATPDGTLFVYVSTCLAQVQRGAKKGSYFLFSDSNYQNADLVEASGISLGALGTFIKGIPTKETVLVVDVAHSQRPSDSLFKTMIMYPPRSLYKNLAEACGDCVVVGSCKLGPVALTDALKTKKGPRKKDGEGGAAGEGGKGKKRGRGRKGSDPGGGRGPHGTPYSADSLRRFRQLGSRGAARLRSIRVRTPKSPLQSQVRKKDGKYVVEDEYDIVRSFPRRCRVAVTATVKKAAWATFVKLREIVTKAGTKGEKEMSSYESAVYEKDEAGNSLFGGFVARGLAGEAADDRKQRILALGLHKFLHREVGHEARTNYGWLGYSQTPQLAACKTPGYAEECSVSATPNVPPAPLVPEAKVIKYNSIVMEWHDPEFSGAKPIRYELQCKGHAKYDNMWRPCTQIPITKSRFHAPHLTPGFPLKFRVRAWNYGGWGEFSVGSVPFTPTAAQTLTVAGTIMRAGRDGVRTLLAAMRKNAVDSGTQRLGAKALATHATRNRGFKRAALAKQIVDVLLAAMTRFSLDADIQAYGVLVVGWACFGHSGVAAHAIACGAEAVLAKAKENFPSDVAIACNLSWASATLHAPDEPGGSDPSRDFDFDEVPRGSTIIDVMRPKVELIVYDPLTYGR